jgi:glycosyltransferase involved in cell wall biosynthesis
LPVYELINNWAFSRFAETYRSPQIGARLDQLLEEVRPDILHIHSLLNLSFDLPGLARARGIPSVATLHDFTLVCPSGGQRVHVAEEHVCREIDTRRCSRCFPESPFHSQLALGRAALPVTRFGPVRRFVSAARTALPMGFGVASRALSRGIGAGVGDDDIKQRLGELGRVIEAVALFVAPSRALAFDFQRFGIPREKIRISDYGFSPLEGLRPRQAVDRLRIGFVGTLVWHKGAHVLLETVRRLPLARVEVKLFGDLRTFPEYVARLRRTAEDLPVRFMGAFDIERAGEIYGEIDVLVVPSLWPENSPLVIHEAFLAGVPVVGSRMGGIPELVEHDRNGLLYDAFSKQGLAEALCSLIDDPVRLRRLADASPAVKSLEQDATEWEAIYDQVRAGLPLRATAAP